MSFESWLNDTKKAIVQVENLVLAVEAETKDAKGRVAAFNAAAATFAGEAAALEGKGSVVERNSSLASNIRIDIASLQHDAEIVVTRNYLLAKAGFDLKRVFEPYDGEFGSRIEQMAPATLDHQSTHPQDLSVPGQNSLRIPLRVVLLGTQQDGTLHTNFVPKFFWPGSSRLAVSMARPPSYFGTATTAAGLHIEDRATKALSASLGQVSVDMPQIDLIPTSGGFNATWIDDHLRCVSTSARRRSRRRFLPSVPPGFELAMKFDQEFVWRIVRDQVAQQGSLIFAGPTVTGAKSFSLTAGIRDSGGVRVGCVDLTWSFTVKVSLVFDLVVKNKNVLIISGKQVGKPDFEIKLPGQLDWMFWGLKKIIEAYIADKVPALEGISLRYVIGNARQIDVAFWDAFAVFAIKT